MSRDEAIAPESIEALIPDLHRFARSRVRSVACAEDAVSEAILAVLQQPDAFARRSSLKTWMIGILKHKLADQVRQDAAHRGLRAEAIDGDATGLLADERTVPESDWPSGRLQRKQFAEAVETGLAKLPARQRAAFIMRESLDMDTSSICDALGIHPAHLFVVLHRARAGVRGHLSTVMGAA